MDSFWKKRTIKNRSIFGLTKKGEYKYKYKYLDWHSQKGIKHKYLSHTILDHYGPFWNRIGLFWKEKKGEQVL